MVLSCLRNWIRGLRFILVQFEPICTHDSAQEFDKNSAPHDVCCNFRALSPGNFRIRQTMQHAVPTEILPAKHLLHGFEILKERGFLTVREMCLISVTNKEATLFWPRPRPVSLKIDKHNKTQIIKDAQIGSNAGAYVPSRFQTNARILPSARWDVGCYPPINGAMLYSHLVRRP